MENKGIYTYIYIYSPKLPQLLFTKKKFQSNFIISFSQLVFSHELGATYFDIFLGFFPLSENKRYSIIFISCISVSKSNMFRLCFSFKLYTYRLNISKKMIYYGFILICVATPKQMQGNMWCKYW